jgi:hypothetical protein
MIINTVIGGFFNDIWIFPLKSWNLGVGEYNSNGS